MNRWGDPYTFPNTDVLKNKLGITDYDKLCAAERNLTSARQIQMESKYIKGNFDMKYLCAIHKHLFQDVYDWAGKTRNVDIAKGNAFCPCQFIEEASHDTFNKLKNNDFFVGKGRDEAIRGIVDILGDINMLHPFREGNGRTQRVFIDYLCRINGFQLDFSKINPEENLIASRNSLLGNNSMLEKIIEQSISFDYSIDEQKKWITNYFQDKTLAKSLCSIIDRNHLRELPLKERMKVARDILDSSPKQQQLQQIEKNKKL